MFEALPPLKARCLTTLSVSVAWWCCTCAKQKLARSMGSTRPWQPQPPRRSAICKHRRKRYGNAQLCANSSWKTSLREHFEENLENICTIHTIPLLMIHSPAATSEPRHSQRQTCTAMLPNMHNDLALSALVPALWNDGLAMTTLNPSMQWCGKPSGACSCEPHALPNCISRMRLLLAS